MRYFFHLRDGTDDLLDSEGSDLAADAVEAAALAAARDCMSADVKGGTLDLRYRIDVEDEAGHVVVTVPFASGVTIVPAG